MKSRTWMWTTAFCLFAALALPLRSAALDENDPPPAIITFDVPGAGTGVNQGTFPIAINPKRTIPGIYVDSNNIGHGFLRARDGGIATFDVPGDVGGLFVTAINPAGAITGAYLDANGVVHGYLRAPDGAITTFDAPGAGAGANTFQGTLGQGINPAGAITGFYIDSNNVSHGFLRAPDGMITTFDAPGAGTGAFQGTFSFALSFGGGNNGGINPAGAIAAPYSDTNNLNHGFVRARNGTITMFDVPGGGSAGNTSPVAINPNGAITGTYFQPIVGNPFGGNQRGFLRDRDGTITTFDAATYLPCCIFTNPQAVNPDGAITGYDNDGLNIFHGFLRARDGIITTFDAPGAGTGRNQGTLAFGINPKGAITGYYLDANKAAHGFLRTSGCDRDGHERECEGDE